MGKGTHEAMDPTYQQGVVWVGGGYVIVLGVFARTTCETGVLSWLMLAYKDLVETHLHQLILVMFPCGEKKISFQSQIYFSSDTTEGNLKGSYRSWQILSKNREINWLNFFS